MPKQRSSNSSPLFILVAMVTVVAALYFAKAILLPLGIAILLCFLLAPVANWLERWGLPRVPATLLVVVLLFTGLGMLGYIVTTQALDLRNRLPNYRSNVVAKVHGIMPSDRLREFVKQFEEFGSNLVKLENTKSESSAPDDSTSGRKNSEREFETGQKVEDQARPRPVEVEVVERSSPTSTLAQLRDWVGPVLAPFGTAGMVVVLVFFMLLDRESQRNRLLRLFGTSNLHATTEAMHDASHRVGRYLRMQFLVNASYGIAVGIGLSLIGVPGAVLWGVLSFSMRFVPYIGPWIASLAPIIVSLGHSDGWTQPLLVVGWFIGLELVCNNLVEPWVYGSTTGVSVVGVILSAIFWTWLWGPVGLILALPITVCLVVAARYVPQLHFLTILFADQPAMSPSEQLYQRLLSYDYHEPVRMARRHLKDASLAEFYDNVLIPALVLAEHDRHAGLLSDDQEAFVTEAVEDLVEELADAKATRDEAGADDKQSLSVGDSSAMSVRVLCAPLRDEADEAASRMLAQLLSAEGLHVETGGAESLTSEIVEHVAKHEIDVVVISILPPIGSRDSRLMWKRLRSRYPELPIIVGFWHGKVTHQTVEPPENDTASKVVTSLAEAVGQVRAVAAQTRLVAKTG